MITLKEWIYGVGHCDFEKTSDFKWSVRDGLFVAIMLEIFVAAMVLAVWLIMDFFDPMFFGIGTVFALVLGYVRFGIQWKWFNPY